MKYKEKDGAAKDLQMLFPWQPKTSHGQSACSAEETDAFLDRIW